MTSTKMKELLKKAIEYLQTPEGKKEFYENRENSLFLQEILKQAKRDAIFNLKMDLERLDIPALYWSSLTVPREASEKTMNDVIAEINRHLSIFATQKETNTG